MSDLKSLARDFSTVIVLGKVMQVLPARWTTPTGARPANPHAPGPPYYTIYRPVVVEVEQYLKGERPETSLSIVANGGRIGQDSVDSCGDTLFDFHEGEQVVLLLYESPQAPSMNGTQTLRVVEHYTITDDGYATRSFERAPLESLLEQIQGALTASP